MAVKTIIIANIGEFNRRTMHKAFTQEELYAWDEASRALTDMSLFWCGDDKVVVLPKPPDQVFLLDVKAALGYENVRVVSPALASPSICQDIINDRELFDFLVCIIENSDNPQIVSWGMTSEFISLINQFHIAGVQFETPEMTEDSSRWTNLYFESKAGFREFISNQLPALNLADGFTCTNKENAIGAISHFCSKEKGFVLKANNGTGGFSTICYPKNLLHRGISFLKKDASRRMVFDHFWDTSPVIIEEHISGHKTELPPSLTIDLKISRDKIITQMGSGIMIIRRNSLYSGILCGIGVLNAEIEKNIIDIGVLVGNEMAQMGYVGWFDIDFVLGENGKIYLTEINARRASPIYVFEIARTIFGSDWASKIAVFANDHLSLQGSCYPTYSKIREVFKELNAANSKYQIKAIPTIASSSLLRKNPYMGYVIVANNIANAKDNSIELEKKIKHAIGMVN